MFKPFSKLSIGIKFALIASALVLVSFGVLTLLMSMTMTPLSGSSRPSPTSPPPTGRWQT